MFAIFMHAHDIESQRHSVFGLCVWVPWMIEFAFNKLNARNFRTSTVCQYTPVIKKGTDMLEMESTDGERL